MSQHLDNLTDKICNAPSVVRSSAISRFIGIVSLFLGSIFLFLGIIFIISSFFNSSSIVELIEVQRSANLSIGSALLLMGGLLFTIRYLTKKIRARNKFIFELWMMAEEMMSEEQRPQSF